MKKNGCSFADVFDHLVFNKQTVLHSWCYLAYWKAKAQSVISFHSCSQIIDRLNKATSSTKTLSGKWVDAEAFQELDRCLLPEKPLLSTNHKGYGHEINIKVCFCFVQICFPISDSQQLSLVVVRSRASLQQYKDYNIKNNMFFIQVFRAAVSFAK